MVRRSLACGLRTPCRLKSSDPVRALICDANSIVYGKHIFTCKSHLMRLDAGIGDLLPEPNSFVANSFAPGTLILRQLDLSLNKYYFGKIHQRRLSIIVWWYLFAQVILDKRSNKESVSNVICPQGSFGTLAQGSR